MEFEKQKIVAFYDRLSAILTRIEDGDCNELEPYFFLVNLHRDLAEILN